jgi:hypothetical protein
MSFWSTSTGEDLRQTDGTYEAEGGNLEPIPNNTTAVAMIDEAKWDTTQIGDQFVSLRWTVLSPPEYKNRKVFQKLWIRDPDPRAKDADKKRDNAKKMFAAIDKNCGGKLLSTDDEPNDERLGTCLVNKPMMVEIMVWEMTTDDNKQMRGNWIRKVSAKNGSVAATPAPAGRMVPKPAPTATAVSNDVPF